MTEPVGALARVIRRGSGRRLGAEEHCDLCGTPVPEQHRHLLDEHRDELLCTCQACTLLFQRDGAGFGHYQLVPDRRLRLGEIPLQALGIPVGVAFFVRRGPGDDDPVVAHYPSPAGATQWEVDPEAWRRLQGRCPPLRDMAPRVQALLVNTTRDAKEHWIVPLDDCFRLVAVVRREWTGLSGGTRVWLAIEQFFAGLGRRPGSPLRSDGPR